MTRQMRLTGAGKGQSASADGAGHTYPTNAASVLSVDTIKVPQERVFYGFPQARNAFGVTRKGLMANSALVLFVPLLPNHVEVHMGFLAGRESHLLYFDL